MHADWLSSDLVQRLPVLFTEAAFKGSPLLLLPFVFARLWPRASAASRHALWVAVLAAFMLLPVAMVSAPGWSIQGVRYPSVHPTAPAAFRSPDALAGTATASAIIPAPVSKPEWVGAESGAAASSSWSWGPQVRVAAMRLVARALGAGPLLPAALWLVGFAWVLGRYLHGRRHLAGVLARSYADPDWDVLFADARRQLRITRPIALRVSSELLVPLACGVRRAHVLVPATASDWPLARRRAVLIHELAHIERRDCLTQAFVQLACALYWFHPGVWYAAHRLRVERERACDDRALAETGRGSDYAEHLVAVARAVQTARTPAFGAVAFAHRSELEGRLLAVLDPNTDRRPVSRLLAWRLGAIVAVIALPLATLRPDGAVGQGRSAGLDAVPASRTGAPSHFTQFGEPGESLGRRWERAAESGGWVGWSVERGAGERDGLLCDSGDFELATLTDEWKGVRLVDVIEGQRARMPDRDQQRRFVAILLQRSDSGHPRIVRTRLQTFDLPAQLAGTELVWLGEARPDESVRLLVSLESRSGEGSARSGLTTLVAQHPDAPGREDFLLQQASGARTLNALAEAIRGLSTLTGTRARAMLLDLTRRDPSEKIRNLAIEAIAESGDEAGADALLEIASDVRTPESIRAEVLEALKSAADERHAPSADSGAPEAAAEPGTQVDSDPNPDPTPYPVEAPEPMEAPDPSGDTSEGKDAETKLQSAALDLLGGLDASLARPRLREIANGRQKSEELRVRAVEALTQFEEPADVEFLTEIAVRSPAERVAVRATEALVQYPEPQAIRALTEIARTARSHRVRRSATGALSSIGSSESQKALLELALASSSRATMLEAIEGLGCSDADGARPILTKLVRTHRDPLVRKAALESLSSFDPEHAAKLASEILDR